MPQLHAFVSKRGMLTNLKNTELVVVPEFEPCPGSARRHYSFIAIDYEGGT